MKSHVFYLVLVSTVFALFFRQELSADEYGTRTPNQKPTSPLRLLTNPASFDGSRVVTDGFIRVLDSDVYIFISAEDAQRIRAINGFRLLFSEHIEIERSKLQQLDGHWVLIEAKFVAAKGNEEAGAAGILRDVSFIKTLDKSGNQ